MTGTKLKVAVLYDVWGDDATAEAVEEKVSSKKKKKKKPQSKSKREKEDREEIFEALESWGMSRFIRCWMGRNLA
jgi:hypothetical protein